MRFRKLRIAFSATCLIACVLLIVLWVRSYWWMTIVRRIRLSPRIVQSIGSLDGKQVYRSAHGTGAQVAARAWDGTTFASRCEHQ